jgi:hypothetical protein
MANALVYHSERLEPFLKKLREELKETFAGCGKIAVKLHFGEPGNRTAFTPEQIRPITELLKGMGLEFFLFDTPVAYGGSVRNDIATYKKYAREKGWHSLGEVVIADDFVEVRGKDMTYQVSKQLAMAGGVLVVSHFKGHICAGFGGAVKNLGMGAVTKKSKNDIHEGGKPVFSGKCSLCRKCENACPLGTLKVWDRPVFGECYGCSDCSYACLGGLIKPKVGTFDILLAGGANAAQSVFKKYYYVSFLSNITQRCDCVRDAKKIIAKDCGFMASRDAVAIDAAARDVIVKSEGRDVFLEANKKSGMEHVREAERLGMGISKYELAAV